jgi:hypothetical protein
VTKAIFVLHSWLRQNSANSLISQTEWPISECGKEENHIGQLATTSCEHNRINVKRLFYLQHKPQKFARAVRNRYAEHF